MLSSAAFCLSEPASAAQHSLHGCPVCSECPPMPWIQERGATLSFSIDSSKYPQALLWVHGLTTCVNETFDLSPGMSRITSGLAYGHRQLMSHDRSLSRSSASNWPDLLYQLTVQIQIRFTNRCTLFFKPTVHVLHPPNSVNNSRAYSVYRD